ncbi:hydroxyproline dehydrogenase [Folsomia candida]|uniref:Proline dehydrogenase n=1 Tax=Folsomia candida TaxID=158441 RepID=A0A226E6J9_FOLCA|nr:hydroxyproline dehydrogenase [Folsomia candida]OXA52970.1 putative proline dehydrogenase 2 [Folsomia candida]
MRLCKKVCNPLFAPWNRALFCTSTAANHSKIPLKAEFVTPTSASIGQIRNQFASWIAIGSYKPGLLSHLSTPDIMRALFVLRTCSYDFVVSRSIQLFNISTKFGPLGEWGLRKTFFNQFVGGDTLPGMKLTVESMQRRGLVLMVAPVLEEDIEDEQSSQKTYDDNLQSLLNLANMTSALEKKKPIIQLKPTAIMPAITLEKVSKAMTQYLEDKKVTHATLISQLANCIEHPKNLELKLSNEDKSQFLDGLQRADVFVKHCRDLKVHVLVDAEFYSCKPAISAIALILMARHNGDYHHVGNTIQAYLKDAVQTIESELKTVTEDIGVNWYGKIVRGAYMDRERYLADKNGYISPVCDTYEATNISYNKAVKTVLKNLSQNPKKKSHLLVASHNEVSIRLAAQAMKDYEISANDDRVSFAQIYGMADYLSTPLVSKNYHVYKSTPYGPIVKVLPYLARRASENRSVMMGAREERDMLWKELKMRFKM